MIILSNIVVVFLLYGYMAIRLYGIDTAIQTKISTTTRFLDKDRVSDSRDGSIEGKTRI